MPACGADFISIKTARTGSHKRILQILKLNDIMPKTQTLIYKETPMTKPNLFSVATGELSQDGFFTWLFQWADPQAKQYDLALHQVAIRFVQMLLGKYAYNTVEISTVKAGRKGLVPDVDIWALINSKYLIIIEDKTDTHQHGDQLAIYKKRAEELCQEKHWTPLYIYLKTGAVSKADMTKIEQQEGYICVERTQLLDLLKTYTGTNAIFTDYYEYLNTLEQSERAFETTPLDHWNDACRIGFYKFLENTLDKEVGGWRWVNNKGGGFWGCWFLPRYGHTYDIYLQIEKDKETQQSLLCFKIMYDKGLNKAEVRNQAFAALMHQCQELGCGEVQKPRKFATGTYMTIAIVEAQDWLGPQNRVINTQQVVDNIKKYQTLLDYYAKNNSF